MCVSAAPARLSGTTVYAGTAVWRDGSTVHVLGYENVAQHLAAPPPPNGQGSRWRRLLGARPRPAVTEAAAGNAMLLHFPAVPGTMTRHNAVDTEHCPLILQDMVRALQPPPRQRPAAVAFAPAGAPARVEVFQHGIYTVVLADDARAIPGALEQVAPERRPPLNAPLFDWYQETFPGWPVALCCFSNTDAVRATPLLWWYRPAHPDLLFAPAIDCHTGAVPDLSTRVAVDHWLVLGADDSEVGVPVTYTSRPAKPFKSLLPGRVLGARFRGKLPNADFVVPLTSVRDGDPDVRREVLSAA